MCIYNLLKFYKIYLSGIITGLTNHLVHRLAMVERGMENEVVVSAVG